MSVLYNIVASWLFPSLHWLSECSLHILTGRASGSLQDLETYFASIALFLLTYVLSEYSSA